ncbi:hypothetical protein C3B44_08730 [Corynebacterium yudongzhengii]|uniref:Maltokinase n=1 Tax=Corynebacterium yudongzhengii TaxID=2080740 RepID=A0A2U1T4S7_9CORY|nr:hypothetical protein [Corynebacterium yudongzhengii]AWB82422.1 hypothetical protein C3B44_08730 [Corynebacterium yudongzhengii]PWC00888.1 hypothetical protein DF222_10375 [Corynebacterium yudongzhengii]
MSLQEMLKNARFYGAKSEPIDDIETVASAPAVGGTLKIVAVTHGGVRDLYQVLVDEDGRDVLGDDAVATEYGQALAAGVPAGLGTLHGDIGMIEDTDTGSALQGEQSNTSLVFRDAATGAGTIMVKVFRRLEPGLSPDVELLSQIPECENIAAVRGWVSHRIGEEEYTLAMAQDYVAGGRDGFERALSFAAEGRSFAAEARLLGAAMRTVHDHLAEAFGTHAVPGTEITSRLRDKAAEHLGRVDKLADYRDAVLSRYDALADDEVTVQRIHGDLHLGQVLRTADRFVLIDFEGEPARPLAERRLPDSPLRDVAGMLRSLDYAAHLPGGHVDAAQWVKESTAALLEGYGISPSPLLDAYLLDKALYEVNYELNNRPDWAGIPLDALARIMG